MFTALRRAATSLSATSLSATSLSAASLSTVSATSFCDACAEVSTPQRRAERRREHTRTRILTLGIPR